MVSLKKHPTSGHLLKHPASGRLIKGCSGGCRCAEGNTCTHCGSDCTPNPIYATFLSVNDCNCLTNSTSSQDPYSLTLSGPYELVQGGGGGGNCDWYLQPPSSAAKINYKQWNAPETECQDSADATHTNQLLNIQLTRGAPGWTLSVVANVAGNPEIFRDDRPETTNNECEVFPGFVNDYASTSDCVFWTGLGGAVWGYGGEATIDCEDGV